MKITRLLLLCTLCLVANYLDAAAQKNKGQQIPPEKHLEKIPATDPAASQKLEVIKSMRGVHPRLLLSSEEFAAINKACETDALLKRHRDLILSQGLGIKVTKKDIDGITSSASTAVVNALGRIPNLVFAHGLQPSAATRDELIHLLKLLIAEPYWDTTQEVDAGMGGSCVMLLAALTFDMVCNDLDKDFRKEAAQKLFLHARRMFYLGHQKLGLAKVKYWQPDPGNNHRWFRDTGLVSCLMAVADEDGVDAGWLLEQAKNEIDFVMKWLPDGGECHESVSYSNFGFAHLAMPVSMMDRVIGTTYRKHPGLAHAWELMVYSWSPSMKENLSFGDSKNRGDAGWNKRGAFFIGPMFSRDPLAQVALKTYHDNVVKDDQGEWTTLCFYDYTVQTKGMTIDELPTNKLFADLGLAYMRDSWKAESPLFMFKCGPMGGYSNNAFRHDTGKIVYINVAHNDPDANSFSLIVNGGHTSHPGIYDNPKFTANQNTILIDGKGQIGEGAGWLQPVKDVDMRTLSYLTAWKQDDKGCVIVEGEAAPAYADLKTFRRTSIWKPNEYILILDNIVANKQHSIAWTNNCDTASFIDQALGTGIFEGKGSGLVRYQVLSNKPIEASIAPHTLLSDKGNVKLQKTSFTAKAQDARFVCLLNPWQRKDLKIEFEPSTDGGRILVSGDGITDEWQWKSNNTLTQASDVQGKGKSGTLISINKDSTAPHGDGHHAFTK